MRRCAFVLLSFFALQLMASAARPSIVLVTGPVADLTTGKRESSAVDPANNIHDPIYLIKEQALVLTSALSVDGTPVDPMGPGGVIPADTSIQSWILHYDMEGAAQVNTTASGVYDFGLPILGLIFSEQGLDSTDSLLGKPGTVYPTGVYYRDSNDSEDPADMWSMTDATTLHIDALQNQGIGLDQIRVITSTSPVDPNPEPTSFVVWLLISASLGLALRRRRSGTRR